MGALDTFGSFDSAGVRPEGLDNASKLFSLRDSFKVDMPSVGGIYDSLQASANESLALFAGVEDVALLENLRPYAMEESKRMLDGVVDTNGRQTLGLKEIGEWKINPEFREQNIKQQAGYAAEVASTAKENIKAAASGSEIRTYRADDRPDLGFSRNDQYVDKVRVDGSGKVIERVQTKFIGKDGADWVRKMSGEKFEKYLDGERVDKLECPKDYYDDAKASIVDRKGKLAEQLEKVTQKGKTEAVESVQKRIDKLNKIDQMLEQSTMTTDEARNARMHPLRYTTKVFAPDIIKKSATEGLKGAGFTAALTFVSSAVTHGSEFLGGEISADEMARKVAFETGAAGALGGATGFISSTVARVMQSSSCNLIRNVGGSCLPASIVSFAVESYDSVTDFAQGTIGANELAHDLGHNAATIAGGALAGGKAGAIAGTVFGPVGTAAGGIVGGLVGSAVASGAYETAVEYAPEVAGEIANKVEEFAKGTMDVITNEFPDQVDGARASFNDFFSSNGIPISI